MPTRSIIITADDFGVHPRIDDAIVVASKTDLITSVAAVANGPTYRNVTCAQRVKIFELDNPHISVGLHFTITSGAPVSGQNTYLTNGDGFFKNVAHQLPRHNDNGILKDELERQIRVFEEEGILIRHFSDHQGLLSRSGPGMEAMIEVVRGYNNRVGFNAPIRNPYFISYFYDKRVPCMDRSKLSNTASTGVLIRNVFIEDTLNKFRVGPENAEKKLSQIHDAGIPTTDYFIETLYGKANGSNKRHRKVLECIIKHAPSTRFDFKTPGFQLKHPLYNDEVTSELMVHLAIVPKDFLTNPIFLKDMDELEKTYPGVSVNYLTYRRGAEFEALKVHLDSRLDKLGINKFEFIKPYPGPTIDPPIV